MDKSIRRIKRGSYIKLPHWPHYYEVAKIYPDKSLDVYINNRLAQVWYRSSRWNEWEIKPDPKAYKHLGIGDLIPNKGEDNA